MFRSSQKMGRALSSKVKRFYTWLVTLITFEQGKYFIKILLLLLLSVAEQNVFNSYVVLAKKNYF